MQGFTNKFCARFEDYISGRIREKASIEVWEMQEYQRERKKNLPEGDFLSNYDFIGVMGKTLDEHSYIRESLTNNGQLLEGYYGKKKYKQYLFHCLTVLDGLLSEELTVFDYRMNSFERGSAKHPVFLPNRDISHPIFRVREIYKRVYATEEFRDYCVTHSLTGLVFDEVKWATPERIAEVRKERFEEMKNDTYGHRFCMWEREFPEIYQRDTSGYIPDCRYFKELEFQKEKWALKAAQMRSIKSEMSPKIFKL